MLDTDTKRRIDAARDILVGKVPDPKSQVEQITIALIYKFMDDMDAESEELGGRRTFFAGDFAAYGWNRVMHSGLGGHNVLRLYTEAIARMPENAGIPALFRDIFKNAYLPYRDPETLRAFLKVIDEFTYDHSERLGDAFEYLLSILGSQGDAGQFRTPRHIIDFMVEVIAPSKTETVLDPACGTAGFLISSYKHILRANTDADGSLALTPGEKERLALNFKGYDISPDMVRLSLANLYLHGFADPHVSEYDTLTSQERWNEYADVILANPPFMSPTGGIKPHNRFSVRSKRSEVLFVDYILEHLTPSGRAGIIVPEGILFQSQAAYAQLRRLLVKDSLLAVISLPQGIFKPYSDVKTSILILDKRRAPRASDILFVRVDDDGHDLGATRKKTGKSDLPETSRILRAWFEMIDNGGPSSGLPANERLLFVPRQTVAGSHDSKLTSDSYRDFENASGGDFPWIRLGELLGPRSSQKVGSDQEIPVLSITMRQGLVDQADKFKRRIASADISNYKKVARNSLVVGFPVDEGVLGIQTRYPFAAVSPAYDVWFVQQERLDLSFFELMLRSPQARARYRQKMRGTAGRRRTLDKAEFLNIEFPLPPLPVQREIVAEIALLQGVVDGARSVLEHYRPRIPTQPDWPLVVLGDVLKTASGGTPLKANASYYEDGTIPWVKSGEVSQGMVSSAEERISRAGLDNSSAKIFPAGTVLVAMYGATAGQVGLLTIEAATNQAICGITPDPSILPAFLYYHLKGRTEELVGLSVGGAQANISQAIIRAMVIPMPPISVQKKIVAEVEAEQALVDSNRNLATLFEQKIQATLARTWGEREQAPAAS